MDYPLESTFDVKFFTKNLTTGVPTTLAGSPVVVIYEDNGTTEITAAETLTVDFDSLTGLNNLRIAATAANGFEAGKSYAAVIFTGTVNSVSVVGTVILNFTIERSAVQDDVALILADTNELQGDWVDGGRLDLLIDAILLDTGTTLDGKLDTIDDFLDTEIAAILADTNELQTDWTNGGRLDLVIDAIQAVTGSIASEHALLQTDVTAILADTETTIPGTITAIATQITALEDLTTGEIASALTAYDGPTRAEATSDKDAILAVVAALNDPTRAEIADSVLDEVFEGTTTLRQALRLFASALYGKLSGAATATVNIRDEADSINRISATVDASGNRSAVTLNKT